MAKKTKKDYLSYAVVKREALRNPEVRREYEALEPQYQLMRAIIEARIKKSLTQEEIAKRAGTTQSAIARFEAGGTNPTLDFASRLSRAVGAKLQIRLAH